MAAQHAMTKPKPGTTNQGKPMARTCGSSEWHLVSRPPFKCTFHTERKNGNIKYIHYLKKILSVYLDKYVSHARLVSVLMKYVHVFFFYIQSSIFHFLVHCVNMLRFPLIRNERVLIDTTRDPENPQIRKPERTSTRKK